jgi:hypothetical protein
MGSRLGTWTVLGALATIAAVLGACATGNTLGGGSDEGDGGSGGSSSATTASAGGGSTTSAATTTGATTTSAATTTSTSSGMMCTEDPCKLVLPQCGCGAGEACTVDGTGTRSCVPEGGAAWGGECGAEDCQAGSLCILKKDVPAVSTCAKFCADDSDCQAPGGLCVFTLNDGSGGTVPGVILCSDNCDPITNTGCPVAGTSCYLGQEQAGQQRFFTYCYGAGSGTQLASCPNGDECATTYGCFNTGSSDQCLKWCNVNQPSCPGATSCQMLTDANGASIVIGNITYGACL